MMLSFWRVVLVTWIIGGLDGFQQLAGLRGNQSNTSAVSMSSPLIEWCTWLLIGVVTHTANEPIRIHSCR